MMAPSTAEQQGERKPRKPISAVGVTTRANEGCRSGLRGDIRSAPCTGVLICTSPVRNRAVSVGPPHYAGVLHPRRPPMLQLRPNCECCNVDLPPDSTDARICSFE